MKRHGMSNRRIGDDSVCCRFYNGGIMTRGQEVLQVWDKKQSAY